MLSKEGRGFLMKMTSETDVISVEERIITTVHTFMEVVVCIHLACCYRTQHRGPLLVDILVDHRRARPLHPAPVNQGADPARDSQRLPIYLPTDVGRGSSQRRQDSNGGESTGEARKRDDADEGCGPKP